jgi:predicted glycoside hydrolase/deacetylase ChbG (UPF0249 family)
MLIINADDWGLNDIATNNILFCYKNKRVTSVSAMMFMADSERSAELAIEHTIPTGLHLNFNQQFNGNVKSKKLIEHLQIIAAFLSKNRFSHYLYNPLLKGYFDYVYKSQYEEYLRLYKRLPTHIDGHHHMHLCGNMIIEKIIPKGFKVRRNFSFALGEKSFLNRFYRHVVDKWLMQRYICTDFFFSILPIHLERLQRIVNLAKYSNVELMVHPERVEEFNYLMSDEYIETISSVRKGTYCGL